MSDETVTETTESTEATAPPAETTETTQATETPETTETTETTEAPATPRSLSEIAPQNWRELVAGEDESKLNQLKRMGSLDVLANNYFEAQDRIRRGEASAPLPDNPTEEQLAAYRERNNIPAEPGAYELNLGEGFVLGAEDKAVLEPIQEVAHRLNVSNEQMSGIAGAFFEYQNAREEAMVQQDSTDSLAANQALKTIWGGDTEVNKNYIRSILAKMPKEAKEQFESARLPNGKAMLNDPDILVWLSSTAREAMPSASVVPMDDPNPSKTIDGRIKELEGRMGEDGWHKDKDAQQELMQLYEAREGLRVQQA